MYRSVTMLAISFLALCPIHVLAQDNAPPGKQHREMTALEKGDAARRFSIHNEGVGVFVNFAAVPELAPERLIKAIEANFAKRGIPINLQTNLSKGDYTTVTFFIEGTPFGDMQSGHGYDLGELAQGFETVVRAFNQNQAKKTVTPAELHPIR